MTPAIALLVIGGILLVSGWKNRPLLDTALGRETQRSDGGVDSSGDASSSGGVQVPAGAVPSPSVDTHAVGTIVFDGHPVAAWIVPILRWARKHGWKGQVASGYRSYAEQKRIYDSGVRPAAKPGTSNHEGKVYPRGAVDVTDAPGLDHVLRSGPYKNILIWAGSKDPVHFSHPHNGGY